MNVADLLRKLGLERYEPAFRDNDVTPDILPTLTAEDLKELGVTVGHRRQLLDAFSGLRSAPVEAVPEPPPVLPTAERRLLSVMFCDIIGSTELSSRVDPEDLNEIIKGYQALVREAIAQYNGFVARYVGDGVLIYFGWPESHETDAEQAVRAGLAAAAAGRSPICGETIQVRIGIATGLVIAGDPIGTGDSHQQTVIGETPNLAARLQDIAGPNDVVIDNATQRHIGALFECQSIGALELKGLPGVDSAWRVLGERLAGNRFEALHGNQLTPLIGRDEELDWILRRWRQAKAGDGQVVLITGEPGIGKSRLLAALEQRLDAEPREKLRYYCSPHHQENALYPVIARWQHEAGFARGDSPAEKFRKLEALFLPVGTPAEDIALFAELAGIPSDGLYSPLNLTPQQKKQKIIDGLRWRLIALARAQPVLLLIEDLHWSDPSSLELMDILIGHVSSLPVLFVASFRPEFTAPWVGQAGVTLITLNRLNSRQAAELAVQVTLKRTLPEVLLERVVVQADGVPLFIEELTKTVLEAADSRQGLSPSTAVPATLQASLMARLDRLPAARRVAQIGAAIGREFPHAMLSAVAQMPETQLEHALEELVSSGLAFRRGVPPDAVYRFKHALVLDAAYQTMLRAHRRDLHVRLATVILDRFPDIARSQPEILAHHYSSAGQDDQAVIWFLAAGDLAASRYAHAEARSHYQRVLDALARMPETDVSRRLSIDVTLKFTAVSFAASNPGSHLVRLLSAESAAKTLMEQQDVSADDRMRLARIEFWLGRTLHYLNRLPEAMRYYEGVLDAMGTLDDDELLGVSSGMIGRVLAIQGHFDSSANYLARALPFLERQQISSEYIWALSFFGLTAAARGDYAAGLEAVGRASAFAQKLNFPTGIAASKILLWGIYQQGGDGPQMLEAAKAIVQVSEQTGDRMYVYLGHGMLAWAEARIGNPGSGLVHLKRSREICNSLGGRAVLADWFSALYAELLLLTGRPNEAIHAAEEAVAEAMAAGGIFAEGMARRTWGTALISLDLCNRRSAEIQFRSSLKAFESGEARVEAARTHLAWALMDRACREEGSALDHLRAATAQFAASGLTDELRRAEAAYGAEIR